MTITAKATLFFEDHKYGWSESYFQDGIDNLGVIYGDAIALAEQRATLNGAGVLMPYIRVSNEAIKRDSLVQQINLFTIGPGTQEIPAGANVVKTAFATSGSTKPDRPYSAVLLRFEAGSLYHRLMYMRGIPDDLITDPVGPANNQGWAKSFLDWRALFEARLSRWKIKVLSKEDANVFKKVTRLQRPTDGVSVIVTVPGHGYANSDRVRLEGLPPQARAFNGVWRVFEVTADTFTLEGTRGPVLDYITLTGTAHRLEYVYKGITDIVTRGQTHRDTGRPFDSPRGRRKSRR